MPTARLPAPLPAPCRPPLPEFFAAGPTPKDSPAVPPPAATSVPGPSRKLLSGGENANSSKPGGAWGGGKAAAAAAVRVLERAVSGRIPALHARQ